MHPQSRHLLNLYHSHAISPWRRFHLKGRKCHVEQARKGQVPGLGGRREAPSGSPWQTGSFGLQRAPGMRRGKVPQSPMSSATDRSPPPPPKLTSSYSDGGMTKWATLTSSGGSVQGFSPRIQRKRHYRIELGPLKSPLACTYLHGYERASGQLRFHFLAKGSLQSSEDLQGGRDHLFGFNYGSPLFPGLGRNDPNASVRNWNLLGCGSQGEHM